jgi:hypothetical protein
MEENCIGSQSPQRTVVLEKNNNNLILSSSDSHTVFDKAERQSYL